MLEARLTQRVASRRRNGLLIAIIGILLGAIITFLTYWFTYAVVWFVAHGVTSVSQGFLGTRVRIPYIWRHIITGVFVTLLLIDTARRSASQLDELPKSRYLPSFATGGLLMAFGQILAHPQASSTTIVSMLEAWPRLILGSFSIWRDALRLTNGCLPVIDLLIRQPRVVSWEELYAAFPNADWVSLSKQLHTFGGVVFLAKGLSLSEEFRGELWTMQQNAEAT